jgi:hypothetical protein
LENGGKERLGLRSAGGAIKLGRQLCEHVIGGEVLTSGGNKRVMDPLGRRMVLIAAQGEGEPGPRVNENYKEP